MSNEQEQQVVGIEEALAEAYAAYVEFAYSKVRDAFHDLDFTDWTVEEIKPEPKWHSKAKYSTDRLAELHRLIKNADMKTAEEIAKRIEREEEYTIMSFESFVKHLIDTCEHYIRRSRLICHYCSKKATQVLYCAVCSGVSNQRQFTSAVPACDLHLNAAKALVQKEEQTCGRRS